MRIDPQTTGTVVDRQTFDRKDAAAVKTGAPAAVDKAEFTSANVLASATSIEDAQAASLMVSATLSKFQSSPTQAASAHALTAEDVQALIA